MYIFIEGADMNALYTIFDTIRKRKAYIKTLPGASDHQSDKAAGQKLVISMIALFLLCVVVALTIGGLTAFIMVMLGVAAFFFVARQNKEKYSLLLQMTVDPKHDPIVVLPPNHPLSRTTDATPPTGTSIQQDTPQSQGFVPPEQSTHHYGQ